MRTEFLRVLKENHELWDNNAADLSVADIKQDIVEIKILLSASNPINLEKLKNVVREKLLSFLNTKKALEETTGEES